MNDAAKRIVLSEFWIGDLVTHRVGKYPGIIVGVLFSGDNAQPQYKVTWEDASDGLVYGLTLQRRRVVKEVSK